MDDHRSCIGFNNKTRCRWMMALAVRRLVKRGHLRPRFESNGIPEPPSPPVLAFPRDHRCCFNKGSTKASAWPLKTKRLKKRDFSNTPSPPTFPMGSGDNSSRTKTVSARHNQDLTYYKVVCVFRNTPKIWGNWKIPRKEQEYKSNY